MRINDSTQNLPARIRTLQIIVLVLLSICMVRLYNLQIVDGDYYTERAINQRLRTLSIPAPRGTIFDRHGRVLVDSRPVYDVVCNANGVNKLIKPGFWLNYPRRWISILNTS